MVHLFLYCINILQLMQLANELTVSLQLTAYTILLNVNTESSTELYNVHTGGDDVEKLIFLPGQKTGCTHGDHDEEEEARDTGPMITEIWMNKEGHRRTVVRLPSPAH